MGMEISVESLTGSLEACGDFGDILSDSGDWDNVVDPDNETGHVATYLRSQRRAVNYSGGFSLVPRR